MGRRAVLLLPKSRTFQTLNCQEGYQFTVQEGYQFTVDIRECGKIKRRNCIDDKIKSCHCVQSSKVI